MKAADATRIMNNARVHLPGALDDALKLELYNVVNEFLDHTEAWQEDITVSVLVGQTDYDLYLASAEVSRLIALVDANDAPVKATMAEPEIVVLNDTPTTAATLTATVSLKTNRTDSDGYPDLPDWISTKYYTVFVDGLLGRMMAQPAKPYSSQPLAIYHSKRFRNGMAVARSQAKRMNLYAGQAWQYPKTFV